MPDPRPRFARVDQRNPEAWAQCDRCGFWYNRTDLAFQYEWAGTHLYNTGMLVCTVGNRCYDRPFEQLRTIILPPDPPPVRNARTVYYDYQEQTLRILEYNAVQNPPWGAGPQMARALQNAETSRLLEFSLSTQGTIGRITDLEVIPPSSMDGSEILEIAAVTGTPNTPADGRLTSLPAFPGTPTGSEAMELVAVGSSYSPSDNATLIPLDGRLTSLQELLGSLSGNEVMEMVSPNNSTTGANYQISTAALAAFIATFQYLNVVKIPQGSSYTLLTTANGVLVIAGTAAPTAITLPPAASMASPNPVLIKDFIGGAAANNINVTFSNGELCDGQSQVSIGNNYGWIYLTPNPGGGGWYQV